MAVEARQGKWVHWPAKYWAIARAQIASNLSYAGQTSIQSLTIVLFMWVFIQLWRATYSASPEGLFAGLSFRQTIWYLLLAETMMLSRPQVSRTVSEAVKDGSIIYLLNKPYSFLLYQMSVGFGDSVVRSVLNASIGGTLVLSVVGAPPDPRGWPFAAVAMMMGWGIDFCLASLVGLLAFVVEEVAAFQWVFSKLQLLLGGVLIPLDFLPAIFRSASMVTPFAYSIYGPARFFVDPSPERFVSLFIGQLLWLVALCALLSGLYRHGARQLTINGG